MRKRIFIGINISNKEKQLLAKTVSKWADLPVRWTKPDNLHITAVFIGSAYDEEILEIADNARQAARGIAPFDLEFNRIAFGPEQDKEKGRTPRMIWAFGEKSEEFAKLKGAIENQLRDLGPRFEKEIKPVSPHITLGRIYGSAWKKLENPPEIDEKISFSVPADSIEVMESNLLKDRVEYIVLDSIKL